MLRTLFTPSTTLARFALPSDRPVERVQFTRFLSSSSDGGHPDFAKKFKRPAPSPVDEKEIHDRIQRDVASHDVVVYMKGIPEAPQCGFSNAVVKILRAEGVDFFAQNVLADPAVREGIKSFTKWPTIPQVFIKGEFVGGCDIMVDMYQSGELTKTLQDKGVKPKA